MAEFHYEVMVPKFGINLKLLFTDTDSFCYSIPCTDLNNVLLEIKNFMDFSNYPESHPLYNTDNKRKPGLFKDETEGVPITEFVGMLNFTLCKKIYKYVIIYHSINYTWLC